MSQAVQCLFLYANDLNIDFSNICDWFVVNKVSIHFGEDKTKSILFPSEFKKKNIKKFNIKYGDMQIKQHSKIKYLGSLMDQTMSVEAMALNVIHKINDKRQAEISLS